jgi:O-acetyl-ADP-ribose deacetylase (regulator of RNase III)
VIRIVRGELALSERDALLRPVSAEWSAVTPSMRRLELAAGPSVEAQCRALAELPVGSAVITPAGQLKARFMVHVVVRSIEEQVSEGGVRRALQNGVRRLAEWGITAVAMPALGTGAGNLDPEDSAALMLPVLRDALHDGPLSEIDIHVDSDYEEEVFRHQFSRPAE